MTKIRIDGVEYEVSEPAAQAVAKLEKIHAERLDEAEKSVKAAKSEAEKAAGERDAFKAAAEKAEKARLDAADPVKMSERVQARVKLETEARKHIGDEPKLEGLTDRQVKETVLAKLAPEAKFDG